MWSNNYCATQKIFQKQMKNASGQPEEDNVKEQ